ncbi:hypothetical protein CVT24_009436 [Panaeolus cyanescens]|uniref:Uncharacterized protein n=1 Tax=Panaeolus cyanescens TaxID=181874 RepID=A0A409W3I6_9AGAR|nr:hypothetical protein CVT24_009436 [Panaeolus cyanescens]
MHFSTLATTFTVAFAAFANGQTVYLAGDSTMAKGGGGFTGSDGWGQYLGQFLNIPVVNMAIGGRSARSFTEEGRFNTIINTVKSGDFVVIEFGHNDGSAGAVDNGRQSAVGDGYDTTAIVTKSDGSTVLIHSFPYYVQNAINALKAKGAIVISSSQTPNNTWENGVIAAPPRFVGYAQIVASRTGITYINHYAYVVQAFKRIGQNNVAAYFPVDHTHTTPAGANAVAVAFVRGLLCSNNPLRSKLNSAGTSVPGE